jgi:predicted flap endonuclease-1-like 5' DNA nuclease
MFNLPEIKISPETMTHIDEIEGIGTAYREKLEAAGIQSVEGLLQQAATAKGRKELETKTGIGHHHLLRWVNQADLFRVKGIGRQYAELLAKAGVETVRELAERNHEHLHAKLAEVNEAHHHVKVVPSAEHVKHWVEEAKALPPVVQY